MIGVEIGKRQRARLGIYVHVPFCTSICPYCDFTKTGRFSKQDVDTFFVRAERQLRQLLTEVPRKDVCCTLYFGGGTPGMFPADRYAPLVAAVRERMEIEECTLEMNPFHRAPGRFRAYREMGVNRITLGVQALSEKALQFLGRRHTASMALSTVELARSEGIDQVQVDLMYGLPNGLRSGPLSDEIDRLAAVGATGFSTYALTVEARTRFGLLEGVEPAEGSVAVEYSDIATMCARHGMERRETSNYSRYEAKHNNIYWYGWPYLGVGTGAHGLLPESDVHPFGRRYQVGLNILERDRGDDALPFFGEADRLFAPLFEPDRLESQYRDEMIYTLLRTSSGIPSAWLMARGWDAVWGAWGRDSRVLRACDESRLVLDSEGLRLNGSEFLLGDGWSSLLVSIADRALSCRST